MGRVESLLSTLPIIPSVQKTAKEALDARQPTGRELCERCCPALRAVQHVFERTPPCGYPH